MVPLEGFRMSTSNVQAEYLVGRYADGSAPSKEEPKPSFPRAKPRCAGRIDFATVNRVALDALPTLLARWLPDGRVNGIE
jgi:hypothetical protein